VARRFGLDLAPLVGYASSLPYRIDSSSVLDRFGWLATQEAVVSVGLVANKIDIPFVSFCSGEFTYPFRFGPSTAMCRMLARGTTGDHHSIKRMGV